jgi:adenine-specific DNA-methyltransferase
MDSRNFSSRHETILVYTKDHLKFKINHLVVAEASHYSKVDKDGRKYYTKPLRAMGGQGETREARPTLYYPILAPDDSEVFPKRKDGSDGAWRWSREKLESDKDRIEWTNSKNGWSPNYRIYADNNSTRPPETIWFHTEVGSNRTSKAEINAILRETNVFNTPKPSSLIERILQLATDKDSIVLDSFAGSGTTAHAVLKLNQQDGGNRRFILTEMEDYAEHITAERVKRVMQGYAGQPGTGGSFDYLTLGEPVFTDGGELNERAGLPGLRQYIYYAETKQALPPLAEPEADNAAFLARHDDTAYYFHYEPDAVTTLSHDFLSTMRTRAGQYIIYADNCLLTPDFMTQHGIIFKKIPRDISRF